MHSVENNVIECRSLLGALLPSLRLGPGVLQLHRVDAGRVAREDDLLALSGLPSRPPDLSCDIHTHTPKVIQTSCCPVVLYKVVLQTLLGMGMGMNVRDQDLRRARTPVAGLSEGDGRRVLAHLPADATGPASTVGGAECRDVQDAGPGARVGGAAQRLRAPPQKGLQRRGGAAGGHRRQAGKEHRAEPHSRAAAARRHEDQ